MKNLEKNSKEGITVKAQELTETKNNIGENISQSIVTEKEIQHFNCETKVGSNSPYFLSHL